MKTDKLLLLIICILFFLFSCSSTHKKGSTNNKTVLTPPENKGANKDLTDNYVVEYDFKTGLYTQNTLKPKVHYPVVYRIKNINRFAYKIEVKSKDSILAFSFSLDDLPKEIFVGQKKEEQAASNYISENPSPKPISEANSNDVKDVVGQKTEDKTGLVKILNSTLEILDLDKRIAEETGKLNMISDSINKNTKLLLMSQTKLQEISSELTSIQVEKTKSQDKITPSEEDNKNLENSVKKEKNLIDKKELLEKIINKIQNDQSKLQTKKTDLNINITNYNKDKDKLKITDEAFKTFIKDNEKLDIIFSQFRQSYREVNKINKCYDKLYELISYHQLDLEKAKTKLEPFINEQKSFDDYNNQIQNLKSNYYDIQIQYEVLKRNFQLNEILSEGGKVKLYSQADDLMDRVKRMYEKINLPDAQKKLNLIPMITESLRDPNTFEWISAPVQPSGDVVSFDVDIKAKNKTGEKILDERKFRQQEFTRGGTRIDFGLGLAASYFKNTPVYELQVKQVDNLSQITIQQKSDELIVPSLVGLATMSRRSSTYTCLGGSAGLGIDVVNGKIQLSNFFAGPSITFGRYERLTFTTGASFRNVQQLKPGYDVGSIVTETSDDIENYLTDKYKVGFFASLTFVLTKGVKENLKKIPSYR
ncbi:hypothetical protein [Flavobacterium johnsoniae]|uniref:hypothetical protein n=1 Tax=Flavobacterium johnsoniae TaxID=986 RepID=UPI003D960DE2